MGSNKRIEKRELIRNLLTLHLEMVYEDEEDPKRKEEIGIFHSWAEQLASASDVIEAEQLHIEFEQFLVDNPKADVKLVAFTRPLFNIFNNEE